MQLVVVVVGVVVELISINVVDVGVISVVEVLVRHEHALAIREGLRSAGI